MLVDVCVDLLGGLHSLSQLGPVMVALWCGPQQLRQQQRVPHHPLHGLNQEGAEVDVICFTPGRQTQTQRVSKTKCEAAGRMTMMVTLEETAFPSDGDMSAFRWIIQLNVHVIKFRF